MASSTIPTVDLSPFFTEGHESGKKKAREVISQACSEYGFFQLVNHGVPMDVMNRALKVSKTFFESPDEEKLKSSPVSEEPLAAGYIKQPGHATYQNEYLLTFPPGSDLNIYPKNPPEFKEELQEMFRLLSRLGLLIESILNECLGLPPNFLKEYNNDRSWDFMFAVRYFPTTDQESTNQESTGQFAHEDANCITFVLQDDAGGLEVRRDGEWIPIIPTEGTLVVNIGDVFQVLSNNKYKSATHRVVSPKGRSRYSFVFFHNLHGDKWVEPLPQFTKEIGEQPKYRGFLYKEYHQLRKRDMSHPPSSPLDVIHVTHFAIP